MMFLFGLGLISEILMTFGYLFVREILFKGICGVLDYFTRNRLSLRDNFLDINNKL
jgi:hypothetical protein